MKVTALHSPSKASVFNQNFPLDTPEKLYKDTDMAWGLRAEVWGEPWALVVSKALQEILMCAKLKTTA